MGELRPLRILLVEDSPGDVALVQELVTGGSSGHEIETTARLSDAVGRLRSAHYDVALVDLSLPDSAGLETVRAVAETAANAAIVVLTGVSDEETAARALDEGAHEYLRKDELSRPLLLRTLRYAVAHAASAARLRLKAHILAEIAQAVIATDREEVVTYWNRAAERLYGWTADEAVGRPVTELTVPEVSQGQAREILDAHREGSGWEGEFLVTRKDGTTFPARVSNQPLRNATGQIIGVVGVSTDITAEKEAERALRASEERFRALVEEAEEVIAVVGEGGELTYVSPSFQRILGRRPPVGTDFPSTARSALHPDDVEEAERVMAACRREIDATGVGRARVRDAEGGWRTFEFRARNLSHLPLVGGVAVHARDVTERIAMEERLLEARKMEAVARLAGGIAHDFNNTLTVIDAQTRFLADRFASDPSSLEELREIEAASSRLGRLAYQLLAYTQQQVLDLEALDVNDVVRKAAPVVEWMAGQEVRVLLRLAAPLPRARMDRGQLERLLVELAATAHNAMDGSGRITIETAHVALPEGDPTGVPHPVEAGEYVTLAFTDSGQGIPAEQTELVFEPFARTGPAGGAEGLSLSTVYGVMRQIGGQVTVESRVGHGTTFRLFLPIAAPVDEEGEGEGGAEEPFLAPGETPRILVVEDDPPVRRVLRRILEHAGHDVRAASDADEALALAAEAPPFHLAVADVVLPGMRGVELVARLRDSNPRLRAVFVSGYAPEDVTEGISGHRFIEKPFSPDQILRAVDDTLQAPGRTRTR